MSAEDLSIKNSPIVPNIIPAATTSTNPGSFDELHRKCRDVFPAFFEGAKAMLQKPLSSHFSVLYIFLKPGKKFINSEYSGFVSIRQIISSFFLASLLNSFFRFLHFYIYI